MTPDQFSAFLRDPATGPYLDALIADNRRIDAQLAGVPASKPCPFCVDQPMWFQQQGATLSTYRCEAGHTSRVAIVMRGRHD